MGNKAFYLKKMAAGVFVIGFIFVISLSVRAASQSDAIAVRVLPNTNHDSIETWYAKQGYQGSPQSLIVDGYEAIRDGRTVFVNAANIDLTNKKIYTNIYLISYNQESEEKTLDILGQLVSHWKFNSNITEAGRCSISNIHCLADSDCQDGYICSNPSGGDTSNKGKCILINSKTCTIDSDCPVNLFCDNLKSRLIRDVKRLGELNQINSAIESYKTANSSYPSLQSGTYILGNTISVWPSWKETFGAQLGISQSLIDPINTLGYCAGYDSATCWDNKTNTFVNSDLSLPNGSYAFAYASTKNGTNYSLCSIFETKNLGYDTADGKIMAKACSFSGSMSNTAPVLVNSLLNGVGGKEFSGYLMAKDVDGDYFSWKLVPISAFSTWSGIPVLQNTGDPNQKKIYAAKTGNIGNYEMNLILTDDRGASSVTKIILKVDKVGEVTIAASDATYWIDNLNPLYSFYLKGSNLEKEYNIQALDNNYTNVFSNNLTETAFSSDSDSLKITVPLKFPPSGLVNESVTVPFRITAINYGKSVAKDINLTFKIEKPSLNFQCDGVARVGQPYQVGGIACLLGSSKDGNYNIDYKLTSNIPGLYIEAQSSNDYLTADSISVLAPTSSEVTIKATNQYGLSAEKSFKLEVNTFCGDGIKQTPNSEGRGGRNNDGIEECDGVDGIATSVSYSPDKQYFCSTGLNVKTPFPIINNSSCVFASPAAGGGYCGDGYCQTAMEDCSSCSSDCGECAPVCGDGEIDPGEVCDPGTHTTQECDTIVENIPLPDYCKNVTVKEGSNKGTQSCKADCSGWGNCIGNSPDLVAGSSSDCGPTSPQLLGYSCCEMIICVHDGCDCCGRTSDNPFWIDLAQEAKKDYQYENIIKKLTPDNGSCVAKVGTPEVLELCECGEKGIYDGDPYTCPSEPLCPGKGDDSTNNSCVLAQDADNLKNWLFLTNHTTVFYRCWK